MKMSHLLILVPVTQTGLHLKVLNRNFKGLLTVISLCYSQLKVCLQNPTGNISGLLVRIGVRICIENQH